MKFSLYNHHRPHHQHLNSSINISRNIINIIIFINIIIIISIIIYIIMIISIISLLMLLMIVIIMPMLASPGISTRTLAKTPSSRLSRLFARRGNEEKRGRGRGSVAFFYLASPYSGLVHAPKPLPGAPLHAQLVHHLLVLAWLLLSLLLAASYLTLTN